MGETNTDPEPVRTTFDWSSTAPSLAVIHAIAAFENTAPRSLTEAIDDTLYDHVDPQALDALVADSREVTISFVVGEYAIEIDGNELTIDD